MIRQLTLKVQITVNSGDSFTFLPPKPDKTYVFNVDPLFAGSSITIRKGETKIGWNESGKSYARCVCGSDPVQIEVSDTEGPYNIWVVESWWNLTALIPNPLDLIPFIRKGTKPVEG